MTQLFIIAPGSETTLAQLGLPESFTPARYRLRSRMFAAEKEGEYEAIKIRKRETPPQPVAPTNGAPAPDAGESQPATNGEEQPEWEEDRVSEDGAIWPIRDGRIVDWPCFYALMTHVYNTVNPPFHTPVILIAEPVWTPKDHEKVTQFFFEKFKVPAFAMVDAAVAASYAYGVPTATVVDIGLTKADITCIADFITHDVGRTLAMPGCGGEAMTERLMEVLSARKGFTRNMCEQLKKSPICEILTTEMQQEGPTSDAVDGAANPAAAASTGADGAPPGQRKPSVPGDLPRGPGPNTEVGEEKSLEDDEGVLDIASIVTGGNMSEYLAQKEREKQERAAAKQAQKKGSDAQQLAANRPARLPNHKRTRNTFIYEDIALHDAMKKAGMSSQSMADMQSAMDEGPNKRQRTPEPQSAVSDKPADIALPPDGVATDPAPAGGFRREIEVGPERFQAASGGILDRIADAIHRTVQSCPDVNRRGDLWDSMIVVGNGAKIRGFKDALLETLRSKYIISPSSATIFTSELPSNMSTPMATGANTPQPQLPGQHLPHGSSVNPLLIAATTAQNPHLPPASSTLSQPGLQQHSGHSSHAQTPTSIKLAKIPEYFPEWKEVGYDEAAFLGAQLAARVLFVVDAGASKGYMTRTDYNDQGPAAVHEVFVS
ncbi:SWI/SNF and RSC complexes subunit arp9-like [Teratosphaeria destructans]|uniref:SWI/SNF and RSC complexes subunit arp9-like n=1 Tax=Teratosphaeria destructans TaxID=418781 RepID=A0A9W7T1R0_9PEZI|nr:SWI/SNF and RSC complexes subunit arp9-like [Teratosphaeria destructans]